MFVLSALAFFILLTLLILIHEWGHYICAKMNGVEVEEFGFGLPPKAKKLFHYKGTDFTLNWIPFGGFVRLKGENALDEKERRAKGSFAAASIPARMVILLGGVFMNLILALVLLTYGFTTANWIPTYTSYEDMKSANERGVIHLVMGVMIDEVVSGGGAAKVGVPEHSVLRSIDGVMIDDLAKVTDLQSETRSVVYSISRLNEYGDVLDETEEFSVSLEDGKSGIAIIPFPLELSAPDRSISEGFLLALRETKVVTEETVIGLGKLFSTLLTKARVPDSITGIVGIAQLTHGAVQEGFMHYVRLVALLSLSLAVLNVLPFPALDGGRLLFVIAEFIARRPVNRQVELTTNAIGFVFLLVLILLITFNDIVRLF